ncbi:MAG: methylcrotonoyl-CoA carboxylase, partial [Usitatibacteraceae bacterium]
MPKLSSRIDIVSPEFQANAAQMRAIVDELIARSATVAMGGGAEANAKHVGRGKLLPRDRIAALLDPGSPFLELSP